MEGIEFYILNDELWYHKDNGETGKLEQGNTEVVQKMIDLIREFYPEAYKSLARHYEKHSANVVYYLFLIVRRFCKCNFGKLDTTKDDIDRYGRFNFEKVECPLRGECSMQGIVCQPRFNTKISKAEMDVMKMYYDGYDTEEIAQALFISPETVKTHRKNVYTKLGIHEKAEFVKYADKNEIFRDK